MTFLFRFEVQKLSINRTSGVNYLILFSIILNPLIYKISPIVFVVNITFQLLLIVIQKESVHTKIFQAYILSFSYFGLDILGLKIYDIIMLISFLVIYFKKNKLNFRFKDSLIIITFFTYTISSWAISGYYNEGLVEISRYLLAFLALMLFFNIKPDAKKILKFIPIIALANIIQALILYQIHLMTEVTQYTSQLINVTLSANDTEIRLNAFFTDPNKFLCYFFFLFILYEYFYNSKGTVLSSQHRIRTHIVIFVGIIISFSRTGLIALGLYFMLLIIQKLLKNSKIIYLFLTFISTISIMLFVFGSDLIYRLLNFITVTSAELLGRERTVEINAVFTEDSRYLIWNKALEYIIVNPVFGYGPLSFEQLLPYPPHNTFLTILLDFGIIGIIIFILLFIPLFKTIKLELLIPFIIFPMLMLDLSNFRLLFILLALAITIQHERKKWGII